MTHGKCPSCGEKKSLRKYCMVLLCNRCKNWFRREKLHLKGDLRPHLKDGPKWPKRIGKARVKKARDRKPTPSPKIIPRMRLAQRISRLWGAESTTGVDAHA